jgi:hypothetical protein
VASKIPASKRLVASRADKTFCWSAELLDPIKAIGVFEQVNCKGKVNVQPSQLNINALCDAIPKLNLEVSRLLDAEINDYTLTSNPSSQRKIIERVARDTDLLAQSLLLMGEATHVLLYENGTFRTESGDHNYRGSRELLEQVQELNRAAKAARRSLHRVSPHTTAVRDAAIHELSKIYKLLGGESTRVDSEEDRPFERFVYATMPLIGLPIPSQEQIRASQRNRRNSEAK